MNLADFHFIRPYWLLALLPCLIIALAMLKNKLAAGNWAAVCDAELLPYLLQEKASKPSRFALTTATLATVLTIFALAGPTWQRLPAPVFRNDSALVIALDLSRSMDAEDIKPSRLVRARYKIADILNQRKDGQTALLVYAGDAFTVTPLTDDSETINSQLTALTTDIMPVEGSNADIVLNQAVALFKQAGLQKGQILLVTDGVDLPKTLPVAEALNGYSLSVLGVGTGDGAPIALPDGGFLKDDQGHIIMPKVNFNDLARVAQIGKGIYQTLTTDDTDVKTLLSALDQPFSQQGKDSQNLVLELWDDQGPKLLLLVLPLAALCFRKGLLCLGLLVLLPLPKNSYAFTWQDLWQSKDQQAQQAYNQQDYKQAATLFENPDWQAAAHYKAGQYEQAAASLKDPKSAPSAYNQGNALAQSGHLPEAIKAYEQALKLDPNDEDARYNKALVEKELEKQQQQQKQDPQQPSEKDKQEKQQDADKNPQDKPSESSEEQQKSAQKPEQTPEQKTQQQQADEQKTENQEDKQQPEPKKPDGQTAKPEQPQQPKEPAKPTASQTSAADEKQQADDTWLNSIPDDPAGLLKRKFKYQYGQRNR